jgi:hypothetical protein
MTVGCMAKVFKNYYDEHVAYDERVINLLDNYACLLIVE